jgi:HupE/UreJ protein
MSAILTLAATPLAHDIPADVTVHAFIRPEGRTLRLLVRVPLTAMRDVNFPTRGPGFLDLRRADPSLKEAAVVWIGNGVTIYEDDRPLAPSRLVATRISLPSDRSFTSYGEALTRLASGTLDADTEIPWGQAMLDTQFEYAITSERSRFSIHPEFARLGLRVTTVLRFVQPDGSIRAFEYVGDPGIVRLDPRWDQAAFNFTALGFRHILDGTDHLLFLLCLVIPFRRLRPLVVIVTAFTIAHSLTLIASAYGMAPDALWFPPLIETLIAASIVYMALENIVSGGGLRRRWLIAFAFGLVHGFGFSFALRETMQFAGSHLLTSLLFFNLGVELGQVLVIALLVPAIDALFRYVVAERMGTILLSAIVAHTGWHWMIERGARLSQYDWPALDAAFAAASLRWLIAALIVAGMSWLIFGLWQPMRKRGESSGNAGLS